MGSQRDGEKFKSNFEYHKKGPHFRMCLGLGSPWVVSEKSDFGTTHYIKILKTEIFFKNVNFRPFRVILEQRCIKQDRFSSKN